MGKDETKVYLYTRVSTSMQIDGYSLDAQKSRMKAFCEFNDYEIAGEYEEAERLMISVLSAVAEIERENIRVQTMELLSIWTTWIMKISITREEKQI